VYKQQQYLGFYDQLQGTLGTAVVHHISQGEQSEYIALLEDRVAWLMD